MFRFSSALPLPLKLPSVVKMLAVVFGSIVNLKVSVKPSKLVVFLTATVESRLTKLMKSLSDIVSELFSGKLKTVPFSVFALISIFILLVGPVNVNTPVP
ncbi:hypothetical protein D3C85_984770 [compost metagenome]